MLPRSIGHYTVSEKLGEGGMGVVYKALDTRLERTVALKVLPADKLADTDRKRRFVQEAKSASALNHPNIITIYDINTADGVDFISMEYVAGRTLDRIIPRQGMRAAEALRIAVQISDALAAAHAGGIVHRDVKPGNIIVADSGLVKVLDFGLAKLTEKTDIGQEERTATLAATEEGQILGTVAYMSPEQAQGLKVDVRSDIFSFGAVLYEMLTGRRAFTGDTKMSTVAAILNREPEPLGETTPRELDRIVTRCLKKDPARRIQTMADLKVALQELKDESDSGRLAEKAIPVRKRRWPVMVLGLAVSIVAAAAGGWWWWNSRSDPAPLGTNFRQLTFDSRDSSWPSLSPDGKLVTYQSDRAVPGHYDVWVQQVSGGPAIRLTNGPGNHGRPAFSADGSRIYFEADGPPQGIYAVSTLGGESRLIVQNGRLPTISPDGKTIAYLRDFPNSSLSIVPALGGEPKALAPEFLWYTTRPIWTPDGDKLIFWGQKFGQQETNDWWIVPVNGGPAVSTGWVPWGIAQGFTYGGIRDLLDNTTGIGWLGRGENQRIIRAYFKRGSWKALRFDPLTFGTGNDGNPSVAAGMVAFDSGVSEGGVWSLPADTNQGKITGPPEKLTTEMALYSQPYATPDGTKLVYIESKSGSVDVYLQDLRTGQTRALTPGGKKANVTPVISADGERILYSQFPNTFVYATTADGTSHREICSDCGPTNSLSPDGKQFLSSHTARSRTPVALVDAETGHATDILQHSKFHAFNPRFSADGNWICFVLFHSPGVNEIFIAPMRGKTAVPEQDWIPITASPGNFAQPFWSPDGSLVYYQSTEGSQQFIMARRLDQNRHPVGDAFRVYEFSGRLRPVGRGSKFSAVPGRIIGAMVQFTYNVWLMDLPK